MEKDADRPPTCCCVLECLVALGLCVLCVSLCVGNYKKLFTTTAPVTAFPTVVGLPTAITAADGAPMILIPAGPFEMGSENGDSDERPVHTVTLDGFYIDVYEMTNARYAKCVDASVCDPLNRTSSVTRDSYYGSPQYDNYPMIYVSWNAAKTYCEWRGARLPTEAEWEKAARGSDGRTYPWGGGIDCNHANYFGSPLEGVMCMDRGDTTEVGSYPAGVSPYGVYDMAGNVWEWVADWYDSDYYANSPSENPQGPDSGSYRVLRGGAWDDTYWDVRATNRDWTISFFPEHTFTNIGFRCAQDTDSETR